MSRSTKVSRTFEFFACLKLLRKSKQSLRAAEKSQEKVEANSTWLLSRVLWFSVSRNIQFCQGNKNSYVDNFFPELNKNPRTNVFLNP